MKPPPVAARANQTPPPRKWPSTPTTTDRDDTQSIPGNAAAARWAGGGLGETGRAGEQKAGNYGYEAQSAQSPIDEEKKTANLFCLIVNRMQPLFDETTASGGARESDPSPAQMDFNADNDGS